MVSVGGRAGPTRRLLLKLLVLLLLLGVLGDDNDDTFVLAHTRTDDDDDDQDVTTTTMGMRAGWTACLLVIVMEATATAKAGKHPWQLFWGKGRSRQEAGEAVRGCRRGVWVHGEGKGMRVVVWLGVAFEFGLPPPASIGQRLTGEVMGLSARPRLCPSACFQ